MARTRNTALAAVLAETGWSQAQAAAAFVRVAAECGAQDLTGVSRSHLSMWVLGTHPSGRAPDILCETLSRKLGRMVSLSEIGLAGPGGNSEGGSDWSSNPGALLAELGGDDLDMQRRTVLAAAVYSVAGLALPPASWWASAPAAAKARQPISSRRVRADDVEDLRHVTSYFSARDQQRGGGRGRRALVGYLRDEAVPLLSGRFTTEEMRRDTYSAVAEMAYLVGWMAFDASEHRTAQRYLSYAAGIAAEASDGPLSGHILRALAHQAVDLGHPQRALDLSGASMSSDRYGQAAPRERSLLSIVHARSLAAVGDRGGALAAITRAERDLSHADTDEAPRRVGFFQEASLAHETACALRDLGYPRDAEIHFQRSVATRRSQLYARTHSVTLGYLGAVQVRQGRLDEACNTWNQALDAMSGVHSGRARDVIVRMQSDLSPVRGRGGKRVADLDRRAREILHTIG